MYHNVSSDNKAQCKKNKSGDPVILEIWHQPWLNAYKGETRGSERVATQ